MLKITAGIADGALTIGIAGRLTPDGCGAVNRILDEAWDRRQQVKIDLAGVRLVDQSSVEYLADIRHPRVALINLPSYVRRWVEQVSNLGESENLGGE